MGRKSKPPVVLSSTSDIRTEVPPVDGLPAFASYIDVPFERQRGRSVARLFFRRPSQGEIKDTTRLRELVGKENMSVLGARMPYMNRGAKVTPALYEYCLEQGFSEDFAVDLVRLVINYLQGMHLASGTLADKLRRLRGFLDFLSSKTEKPLLLTLPDLGKQLWIDYLEFVELDPEVKATSVFNDVRCFFKSYAPTSLRGWLAQLTVVERKRNPDSEHSSELVDASYSDAVMYQILAHCLEGFRRRIGYLKRYESLTEADMPSDWLYPGRNNRKHAQGMEMVKGCRYETESFRLLMKWLNDEEAGYQTLIDHFIVHHKMGAIHVDQRGKLKGGFLSTLSSLTRYPEVRPLLQSFWKTTASWHGFSYPMKTRSLWGFYLKKSTSCEVNLMINQIAWCLANLLMMQTGINKEVALSIPSRGEDGKSILLRDDTLFVSKEACATEVELYGFKERGGGHRRKVIPISIVKDSPLYEMLVEYEKYVKVDSSGPFFEVNKKFENNWNRAGGIKDFTSIYPVVDESENLLPSIDTTKFRKVFATGQLLDRIQGIKNGNDLAEKLRSDLHHGTLDITLSHYLLKTNVGRSVIDTAIATITAEKLAEALLFKGRIALANDASVKRKVFLCDCEDPTNPSHDVAIATECRHYDLCLGCERSVVTQFHLPYICARILQYEEQRLADPYIWPAIFEDRWSVANDALDQYVAKDKKNGRQLVSEAWISAREGLVSLPPVIIANRV